MKTALAALTLTITIASCWTAEGADRTLRASESGPLATKATPTLPALRLDHSTFLGGTGEDRAHGMAVDAQGNIYLTAPVQSTDFPVTPDALNKTPSGIYFAKLSSTGALLYSTYLGAAGGSNYAHGIALDKEGNVYIAGNTTNPGFPTTPGAFQTTLKGPRDGHHGDAFIVKLSPAGNRIIYSTFLGGSGQDICGQIAVDADGNAYVVGSTSSADLPVTPGAFRTAFAGGEDEPTGRGDIFIAKLNPDGSKLVYSTYVGGSGTDIYGGNLVVDGSGSVLFGGTTTSPDFPTTANAFQKSYAGGSGVRAGGDAVLVKLNPSGTSLEYASYVGGRGDDTARSVALDDDGSIWLAGDTTSDDFPIAPAASPRQRKGGADCFFLKLNPRGGPLLHSSVLGGGKSDNYATIAVHPSGLLVLAGRTESTDFPATPGSESDTLKGPADVFVALFDPSAGSLRYSTLLGGNGNEVPGPLLLVQDRVYLAGNTTSTDFPVTPGAADSTYNGGSSEWGGDAFVTRFTLLGKNGPLKAPRANVAFVEGGQNLNRLAGRGVALADFNGDGVLDAFVVNEDTPDGRGARVYLGDGKGRFADSGQELIDPENWRGKPALGDVNRDGKIDVVTGNTIWINDGRGHFQAHPELIDAGGADLAGPIELADLDGDGHLDIVAVSGWKSLRVYLGDGRGRFRDTGQQLGAGIIGSLAVGDVDGDGAADVISGGWRVEGSNYAPSRVWLNDGKGHFTDAGAVDNGENHVHGVALGDVDGDGWLDVVMACTTPGQAGKVYLNDGKGRFHDSGQILAHRWAHSVALGDFDGDGSPDAIFACGEPATGTPNEIWLNDGKGHFGDSGLRLGNAFSWDAALGDLNGDGTPDAVVSNLRIADGSKSPPVFGGVPLEVWLNTTSRVASDHIGQAVPGSAPVAFARGVVSTDHLKHSSPAPSPDGSEVYWSPPRSEGATRAPPAAPRSTDAPNFAVTYLANSGFMIEGGGKKVLVDALFEPEIPRYAAPSPELADRMIQGDEPFDGVDLLLVTHPHADHFAPGLVVAFLREHPESKLVIHRRGAERMQTSSDYPAVAKQVVALDARLGDINHLEVGGMGVVVVGTTHLGVSRDRFDFATNLIFATALGGVRFMHLGDTTLPYSAVDLARYPFAQRPVDVLFMEYFDLSERTRTTIAEVIKPDQLIAVHVPPASWEVDSRSFHEAFPHGTLFRNPLERRILDCGIDLHGQPAPSSASSRRRTQRVCSRGASSRPTISSTVRRPPLPTATKSSGRSGAGRRSKASRR